MHGRGDIWETGTPGTPKFPFGAGNSQGKTREFSLFLNLS